MVSSITVNIAVGDVVKSTRLLQRLGFEVDPMFATESDMELIKLSSAIYVMLNSGPRFESISRKRLVDTSKQAEAVLQLRVDSRKTVDEIVDAALSAGCTAIHEPNQDGPIYGRSFQDLDGHNWDFFSVDDAK
jgi:uncharacterized protein